ncbi:MAG: D-alanine--D-alanine ligase [Bacteroidetes bacterium]|nr:D-alanine--D-alanine ligase [Bacteroidota bacterium]MBU1116753.1 D-alanine--D-alanine ligase [Bacteroidota bacterium]MBU1798858.1 D-alanine--D-alanine ligase [Bacteroidota bacterium]
MNILFVYNKPKDEFSPDDDDVLTQLEATQSSAIELGHTTSALAVSLNLETFETELIKYNPDLVFNLVESLVGIESFMHFVPLILEKNNFKITGCPSEALYLTTNKILAKKLMRSASIQTPDWFTKNDSKEWIESLNNPFIIKPISADASVGLDEDSVIRNPKNFYSELLNRSNKFGECFGEEYIEGREFNLSILEIDGKPKVMPAAEILFQNYPQGKEKVVGYNSKWNSDSFEYNNTPRSFDLPISDSELILKLNKIAIDCWSLFNLSGYARVDFRVSEKGQIFVLEVNANPCISPDAGFAAACQKAGYTYTSTIESIIKAALK